MYVCIYFYSAIVKRLFEKYKKNNNKSYEFTSFTHPKEYSKRFFFI